MAAPERRPPAHPAQEAAEGVEPGPGRERRPFRATATAPGSAAAGRRRAPFARTRTAERGREGPVREEAPRRRARPSSPARRTPGNSPRSFVHLLDGPQHRLAVLVAQLRLFYEVQQHRARRAFEHTVAELTHQRSAHLLVRQARPGHEWPTLARRPSLP